MATNYLTLLESEIMDLEPRLWRLKQAVEVPDPKFELCDFERRLMKLRYEKTLELYRIMRLFHDMVAGDVEQEELEKRFGTLEKCVENVDTEPDYGSMQKMYEAELASLDVTDRFVDSKWMSVTRPEDSMWKDYPESLKKALRKEADDMLKKTMAAKEFRKMKREDSEESKLDYFQKYEKRLEGLFSPAEIKRMVAEERKYYRDLERWNRKGGKKGK